MTDAQCQCDTIHLTTQAEWPSALKPAHEAADKIGVSVARLIELADARVAPHWRIDGGEPFFNISELKRWAAANMLLRFDGRPIPFELRVMIEPPAAVDAPPEIREISGLASIPVHEYPPGVYFLVGQHMARDDAVLYVGQSVNPLGRIPQHSPQKTFRRAYYKPVPSSALDGVEGALIRLLKPPLNGRHKGGGMLAPGNPSEDSDYIDRYAPGVSPQGGRHD